MDEETKRRMIDDYEDQLRDMGVGDAYTALEMVETREDAVIEDLTAGYNEICLKVPSHSETMMPAELARELLNDLRVRRAKRGW